MPSVEQILVIPESVITSVGTLQGFEADVDRFLKPILSSDQLSFQPRDEMERDPSYKQLIPYILLEFSNSAGHQLFTYTRGGGGGESRLHAKRSVGIGGHISREDAAGPGNPYENGMKRELSEEVTIDAKYTSERCGLIYDPSSEVGRVHLGIVHRFRLDTASVRSNEDDLADGKFLSIDSLRQDFDRLETWSQLSIDALYPGR